MECIAFTSKRARISGSCRHLFNNDICWKSRKSTISKEVFIDIPCINLKKNVNSSLLHQTYNSLVPKYRCWRNPETGGGPQGGLTSVSRWAMAKHCVSLRSSLGKIFVSSGGNALRSLVYVLLIVVMRERVSAGHDLALLKLESLAGQIEIWSYFDKTTQYASLTVRATLAVANQRPGKACDPGRTFGRRRVRGLHQNSPLP